MPLIFSNPRLFPEARASDALVSHVDLLPTLASLIDAPAAARADWPGVDYSTLLHDPSADPGHVQDHIVFTYDDVRCAQNVVQLVPPPNRIVCIREVRYKLARYYDGDGIEPDQWEMYDLENDPEERVNLAFPGSTLTAEQSAARAIDREAAGGRGDAVAAAALLSWLDGRVRSAAGREDSSRQQPEPKLLLRSERAGAGMYCPARSCRMTAVKSSKGLKGLKMAKAEIGQLWE